MTYWMTFFSFQTVESLMPHLLSSIPFYFWFKLAFMVWCYHPATRGAAVIYKLAEPIRDEILSILDPLLDGVVPAASKKQSKPTAAAAKATESDGEYVPSGITVHLDELTISPASSEEDSPSDSTVSLITCIPVGRVSVADHFIYTTNECTESDVCGDVSGCSEQGRRRAAVRRLQV